MDRTEEPLAHDPEATPPRTEPDSAPPGSTPRSRSKVPTILLWAVIAVALLRLATSRSEKGESGGGLVHWTAPDQAVAAARTAGKPILYDFTAEWCAPCKILDREGWGDRKIAALVDEAFVPTRVTDRAREEGRNAAWVDELHRAFQVNAFPTLVVVTADGQPVAIVQGWLGKEKLVEFLENARRPAR